MALLFTRYLDLDQPDFGLCKKPLRRLTVVNFPLRRGVYPEKKEGAVPSFDIRFIKTVCDDSGHEHRACQAAFAVDAASLSEAVRQAEADFCRLNHVHDWTIFADAVESRSQTLPPRPWAH
jgi:hypothetical protein